MNLTRLMALGTLARYGPRHGHEIRRLAEVTNVGEWGGVSVGALYRELRAMEAEGLIEAVRTERVGRRPARTVYAITGSGHTELSMLREQAVRAPHYGPDPLGVALSFAGATADWEDLRHWLRSRREMCALAATELERDRERLVAKGHLGAVEAAVMYRGQLHAETEVRWHDEFAKMLGGLAPEELCGTTFGGVRDHRRTDEVAAARESQRAGEGSSPRARRGGRPRHGIASRDIT
jgi:DNA-binding PadR family transcriptional regulator